MWNASHSWSPAFVFKIKFLCHRNIFFSKYTLLMSFMSLMLHHPLNFLSISTRRHPQRYAHGIHGSIWEHALRSLRREYARHMKLSLLGGTSGPRRRRAAKAAMPSRREWEDWVEWLECFWNLEGEDDIRWLECNLSAYAAWIALHFTSYKLSNHATSSNSNLQNQFSISLI